MYIPNSLSRLIFFAPMMIGLNVELSIYLFVQMLILVSAIVIIMPRLKPLHKKLQEHVGSINDRVWQTLSGITTLKLYTRERQEHRRFGELNEEYIKRHMSVEKYNATLWPLFMTIFGMSEIILLGVGGAAVIRGELTLGELLQFKVMVIVLAFPVLSLGWVMAIMQQGMSAMERIDLILNAKLPEPEPNYSWQKLKREDGQLPHDLHLKVNDLSFTYPNQVKALENLQFELKPGSTLAITGSVGSGKSTLLHLIIGVLKPKRGQILINDIDILDIRPEDLFACMSFVPQNSFLFSKNIEDNIALSSLPVEGFLDSESSQKVQRVSGQAAFDKDVEVMPEQYRTMVGERGITLSGGQRQRMAIARALFKERPLLILDDTLSAVDSETEHEILEQMKSWNDSQSLIIVSHRISALKEADLIIVLDQGNIIETGQHDKLISLGGHYARLSKLQQMQEELAHTKPQP
jgi:ATP-binding cassette subfamily B protein